MGYKFTKKEDQLELVTTCESQDKTVYRIVLTNKKGFIHAKISGPRLRKQTITNIHCNLSAFERKAVAFHLLKKARRGEDIENSNYAEVFASFFGSI